MVTPLYACIWLRFLTRVIYTGNLHSLIHPQLSLLPRSHIPALTIDPRICLSMISNHTTLNLVPSSAQYPTANSVRLPYMPFSSHGEHSCVVHTQYSHLLKGSQ